MRELRLDDRPDLEHGHHDDNNHKLEGAVAVRGLRDEGEGVRCVPLHRDPPARGRLGEAEPRGVRPRGACPSLGASAKSRGRGRARAAASRRTSARRGTCGWCRPPRRSQWSSSRASTRSASFRPAEPRGSRPPVHRDAGVKRRCSPPRWPGLEDGGHRSLEGELEGLGHVRGQSQPDREHLLTPRPLSHPSSLLLRLLTRQTASTSDQVTSAAWRDCSSSRRTPEPPGGAGAPALASRSFRSALAWRAAGSRECAESERRRGGGVERAGDIDRASAT